MADPHGTERLEHFANIPDRSLRGIPATATHRLETASSRSQLIERMARCDRPTG